MAKQLNVNLAFTADTSQAKQQLQQLQQQLNSLIAGSPAKQLGFDTEINKGIDAAARLKLALQEATNATTGKLDLGKFDQQIKKSGITIKEYGSNLAALGPKGQEAFMSLARSISNAEIPLTRVNSKIIELGVVLKNTLKWQISSSVLHGFMSAVSGAYQYAQDLNESLNNIRIVTGQSADQMDKFAEKANKAAKALSATTTEYSNAALIYYQQGLSDEEVLKRTDTTIKLANVSRESAETVSEWMTAIWNNFDNGTRSLESYADTITALGAATASSADEIAEGLEKFSAIAETVGLSYDYATAALATVTSQTRQSADVVGTAFKTLFARLEGLKLGETLEDGVTLNQYSEGLAAVGINILNANGELKNMDTILDQLGGRWDTLSKAQQVALAQTIGGIRQYNQLISLMDNWDTFQQNLTIAQTSEGALQEQADIYAESWEGAQKRVKASVEAIYSDLLNDDFFIDLLNDFSHILNTINSLIDSLGGAKGVLLTVSTLLLQMTGPKIAKGLETMALNMKYFLNPAKAQADAKAIKDQMWKTASTMSTDTGTLAGAAQGDAFKMEAKLQRYLLENASKMTETEQAIYKLRMDNVRALQEANIEHAKAVDLLDKQKEQAKINTARVTKTGQSADSRLDTNQVDFGLKFKKGSTATLGKVHYSADNLLQMSGLSEMNLTDAQAKINELINVFDEIEIYIPKEIKEAKDAIDTAINKGETGKVSNSSVEKEVKSAETNAKEKARRMRDKMEENLGKEGLRALDEEMDVKIKLAKAEKERIKTEEDALAAGEDLLNNSKNQIKAQREWSTTVVNTAQGISSLAMGMSAISGIFNTLNEGIKTGELGFGDLLGILMSLGMAIPMVINGITSLGTAMGITTAITAAATAAEQGYTKEKRDQAVLTALGITLKKGEIVADSSSIAVRYAVAASEAFANGEKRKGILLSMAAKAAKLLEAIGLGGLIPLEYADAAAKGASAAATWALLAPIGLLLLAIGGLAGVIALVATGFKALSDAYNADAIAAEKAREEAKALADAYNEVREKYEELKQTIADYKDAQDAIDQLKQGTQEWRDAVSETNLEILNLLDKYPELAQYVQTLEGGRMIVTEEGLAKVLNQKAENVAIMANMSTMANHRANIAENKAERTDLIRNELTTKDSTTVANAIIGGIIAGGPGVITAMTEDAVETNKMDNFLEQLQEDYNNLGEGAFVDLEERLKDLGVSYDDAAQEIRKLIVEQKNLAETEKIITQQQVDNLLMAQSGFNTKGYTSGIQERARELSDQIVAGKNISADVMHQYSNWNLAWQVPLAMAGSGSMAIGSILDATGAYIETSTELGEDTLKKYLETKGLDSEQYKGVNFKGDKVVWKEKGEGDSAEWSKKELSYEALAEFAKQDYLAEHAAEIATAMNNLMATTRTLSLSNNSYEQALASYLAEGDLSMMSPEVYEELKGASADEITRIFNENEAVFKEAGINSAQDLTNGFDEALKTYDPVVAQQNLINKKWADFKAVIAEGAKELEVSESALKTYTEILITENKALEDNIDIAGQSAVAHFRLAKGVEKVRTAIEDNLGILEEGNVNSLEYAEALGAVRDAVAETFGMNVSANFIEDNLKTIKSMTEGNVEAFKELQKLIVTDYIVNLQLEDNAKAALQTEIDSLLNEVSGLEVKGKLSLDNKDAITALNTALENGSTTTEEIQAMFSNMNLAFPDTAVTTYKKPTKTTTYSENSIWDDNTGWKTTKTKSTVTSEVELPWIGDNPPKFKTDASGAYEFNDKGEAVKIEGTGKSNSIGGLTKMAETSQKQLKEALSYDSDAKGETTQERKARIKSLNDEVDRYHEIEEVLDDISKLQDKISKTKDRAFGAKKVALINAEVKALEAQEKALDKNIEKAKNYLELDKKEAAKYGLKFDAATGNLTNYEELQQKYLNKLGSMDPNNSNYKKVEAEYEAFKAAAQKYEETYDEWEDKIEQKAENIRAQLDAKLEGVSYTVELKYKISDRELARAERTLERLQRDDDYNRAEAIIEIGKGTGAAKRKLQDAQDGIWNTLTVAGVNKKDIQSYMNGNGNVLAEYDLDSNVIDQVEDFTDDTLEAYATIEENEQSMLELISDNFDYWHEKVSAIGEKLESYQSIMKNYTNIIDLVGAKTLGVSNDMFKQMEKTANEAARAQVNNAKKTMETTQLALEEARKNANDKNLRENQREAYAEEAERLEKQLLEDTENYANVWATAIELAYDTFNKETQRAIDDFEDAFSNGFSSMQQYIEQFEWSQEQDNWFVEGYEKAYELSKLTRDLNNQMDKTQNIKNQKILAEFQEEIAAYQKAGVEMSQHDLDILRKRYELKLAEIALEEAQNAKSTVRLQRDSEGNYGYVYTADQNNIDQAQQNYEDKLFAIQQSNDEYLETLESQVLTNRQEMIDALRNLNIQDFANAEEYEKAKEMLIQQYTEKEKYLLEEIQKTFNSNSLVYNTDIAAYGSYIIEHNAKGAEWVRYFKDTTIAELGKGYTDLQEFHNQLNIALGDAEAGEGLLGATKIAMDGLATQVSNIFGDQGMGLTLEQFKKGVDSKLNTGEGNVSSTLDIFEEHVENVMYGKGGSANNPTGDSVVGGIKSAENATKNYAKDAKKSFPAISQEVSTWYTTYGPTLQKGKTDTENLDKALITLFKHKDRDIHAGVDIKSADIEAVKDLTDALDKLTTEVNGMSSKAININVNYKTGSTSNGGNTKQSSENDHVEQMQKWTVKVGAAKPGTVDNIWGKNTKAAMEAAASSHLQAPITFKDKNAAWDWYSTYILQDQSGTASTPTTYTIKKLNNNELKGDHVRMQGGGDFSFGRESYLVSNWFAGYDGGVVTGTKQNPGDTHYSIWVTKNGNKKHAYVEGETLAIMLSIPYKQLPNSFDTGGYTGSWGPEGRIAMLHQKEIVLNAHDTENFLTAIEIVRSIANQMNLNNQKLSEYATSSTRLPKTQTETLQQEVTIHAEFPNATNHNEIEEAFGNLVNLAAQYTNRK